MNPKRVENAIYLGAAVVMVGAAVVSYREIRNEERAKRKQILTDMGLDVAAIHNATDVINAAIERGEIRSMDQLRQRIIDEVSFQKIVIREDQE